MLNLNTKNESPLNTTNSILAFKPRQVILSALHHHHQNPKPTPTMNLVSNKSKCTNLTPEIKVKLDALILNYLNRNGFNKTLKRFRSEAGIETDTWKASSLHLEDIFCKYNACNADGSKNTSKKPVFGQDKPIDYDNVYPTNEEPTTKKKKKKGTTESENGGIVDHSEVIDTKMVESDTKRVEEPELKPKKKKTKHDLCSSGLAEVKMDTANESKIDDSTKKTKEKKITIMQEDKLMPSTSNDNEIATDDGEKERKIKKKKSTTDGAVKDTKMVESDTKKVEEPELKPKKKKTKHDLYSSSQAEVKMDMTNELKLDDLTKKTTEKKKTSMQEDKLMPSTSNDNEVATDVGEKERKNKKKKSGAVKDAEADIVKMDAGSENMSSKEKKSSKKRKRDENENSSNEVTISEESKCQKTQTFKEEKSKKEEINLQETSKNQLDGQSNGKLETNGGEISIAKKSTKKQRNVTNEPKTVNAFQRVKVDQVEFADEKLQDNSYWAKDGADIGYGAKAQEVLGQVRGRDFRHEKTKKKRGSYRGGSIDLQSHSIKFNYSDGE